jgi:uncharacterized protein (DUF169 family)
MLRFEAESHTIIGLLKLKWSPLAGRFSVHDKETSVSTPKLSICEALDMARRENLILTISKRSCTCGGGGHFTGLQIVPTETIAPALTTQRHRVFESTKVALISMNKQPQPVKRGDYFTLGPLEKFETSPDLVLLFVNPSQADRMLGLVSFKGAEPFMYYPASSICSTITNVLAKEKPEINLISTLERKTGKWSPNELVLAMPLKTFESAIENISKSGYGTA